LGSYDGIFYHMRDLACDWIQDSGFKIQRLRSIIWIQDSRFKIQGLRSIYEDLCE